MELIKRMARTKQTFPLILLDFNQKVVNLVVCVLM